MAAINTDALDSYDLTDGYDTDLDAIAYSDRVVHQDNWFSIEGPTTYADAGGDDGDGGLPPVGPFGILGVGGLGGGLIIPVTGGEPVRLDCGGVPDRVFTLQLPSSDFVNIHGLCQSGKNTFWGVLTPEEIESLPLDIPGYEFGAGMTLGILDEIGPSQLEPVSPLPAGVVVEYAFLVRAGMEGKQMAGMFWDMTEQLGNWMQVPEYEVKDGLVVSTLIHPGSSDGMMVTSGAQLLDGYMTFMSNFSGTFVTVAR
ncbi:MAG: hypothetical protein AB9891_21905 [Anaerolineaceae bacterium]